MLPSFICRAIVRRFGKHWFRQKKELSHDLIIDAIVATITKKPIMEIQQSTEGRKLQVIKKKEDIVKTRMNKQKDIQSKREPEVSSLKKSDSNIISKPQYRYITPINNLIQTNLDCQSQPKILAIKIQGSLHNSKPDLKFKGNVLVLTGLRYKSNSAQPSSSKIQYTRRKDPRRSLAKWSHIPTSNSINAHCQIPTAARIAM